MCAEGVQKVNKSKQVAQKCNFRVFANFDVVPILSFWQKRMPIFSFVPKKFCQKIFCQTFFAKNCQIQTWIPFFLFSRERTFLINLTFLQHQNYHFSLQDTKAKKCVLVIFFKVKKNKIKNTNYFL